MILKIKIIILAIFFSGFFLYAEETITDKDIILCFGDSITHGTKVGNKYEKGVSWASLLEEYSKGEIKTINSSLGGRKTGSRKIFNRSIKEHTNITHCIIFLGVNDLRISSDETLDKCVKNITWMINRIRIIKKNIKVTILSSPGLNTETITDFYRKKGYDEKEQLMLDKLRIKYKKCAEENL